MFVYDTHGNFLKWLKKKKTLKASVMNGGRQRIVYSFYFYHSVGSGTINQIFLQNMNCSHSAGIKEVDGKVTINVKWEKERQIVHLRGSVFSW